MTDKEKLEAIRAEIHRLVDVRGYNREMANALFAFMDSLKEDELTKDGQKVSNAYCRKIRGKRVLPILKGESKHKFINEFNTLYQTLDMQLCDRCMKESLKDLCLAFATWGAYNLKHIGGISKEEITKMDSLQEEPIYTDFTKALAECIHQAQGNVVDPMVLAETWKDELIKLAKSEEPVSEELGEIVLEGTNFNKSWYAHPELAFKAGAKWQLRKTRYEKDENNKK